MKTTLNITGEEPIVQTDDAAPLPQVVRRLEVVRRRWIRETEQYLNDLESAGWPRAHHPMPSLAPAA